MLFLKVVYHIHFYLQFMFFKIIYGKRILVGSKSTWRKGMSIMIAEKGQVVIGSRCFFNNDCSINALNKVEIGEGTILGENVKIYDHNHKFAQDDKDIKNQGFSIGQVRVGKHCWVGSNVVLLKDSDIGDNCVIGAGCIVQGKIEANSIVKTNQNYVLEKIRMGEK